MRRALGHYDRPQLRRLIADAMLVVTELGTNVLRHAGGGHILVRQLDRGVELIAVDRGPGIDRVTLARLSQASDDAPIPPFDPDGLGIGLGAVKRLSTGFDVYSEPQRGTVVLARLDLDRPPAQASWAGVNVPMGGDGPSGDAWFVAAGEQLLAVMVDGLGHGPPAAAASAAALSIFDDGRVCETPESLLAMAHRAMRGTRGAVIGACSIDTQAELLSFVGVGNISGRVLADGASRSVVSHGGTLGVAEAVPAHRVFQYPWQAGAALILASDGLRSGWDPLRYSALLEHDPALIAAILHRDFARPNDDASVLVIKDLRPSGR